MKMRHALVALFALGTTGLVISAGAQAESTITLAGEATDCAITYTRTACPGQEAESYKKCDGQKSCTKHVEADSEAKCLQAGIDACSNDRLTVTASKVINAKFKGKALKTKAGKDDLCLDYAKRDAEFNHCSK
jgi:hypothetical protein